VIVTAQKRSESIQDVPSSISVLGGNQLEQLRAAQLTDYAAYMPGFQVDSAGSPGAAQITLRGVNAAPDAGASVGTYIDDSPLGPSSKNTFGSSLALDLMPYDIERIEVLRGPQGTLYGASTMGGLVKYVLRTPDLREAEARAGVEFASIHEADDNGWGVRAGANLPLIQDKLAIRASYFKQDTPGYIDNSRTGKTDENSLRQDGGRFALLWQPGDIFSAKLNAMKQRIRSDNNAVMTVDSADLQPVPRDLSTPRLADEPFDQDLEFYSATLNWAFDWGDLTSATSYSHSQLHAVDDVTPATGFIIPLLTGGAVAEGQTPAPLRIHLDKTTQEVRLASPDGGRVEWLAGVFLTREKYLGFQELRALDVSGTPIPGIDPAGHFDNTDSYEEYALFGDLTYKFTDHFDVTAGVRGAHNHETFRSEAASLVFAPIDKTVYDSADIFTYMVSPRWHVSKDTMIYARVASGYRPGGGNAALFPVVPATVDADTLVNYEVGVKSDLLDSRVLIDAAVFYIDWQDIQVRAIEPTTHVDYIANGPSAKSQGVELSLSLRPARGLRVGLNGSYLEAELTQTADPSLNLGVDWNAGARLPLSPRFSGSVTADYEFPIGGALNGAIGGGYRHVGDRLTLVESDVSSVRLSEYDVLDLSAGLSADHWSLRLFAKNVTDERALLTSGSPATDPLLYVTVMQPRTIGLALDVSF
jgi:outer membrane receptor protein involved in Fe transport